MNATPRVAGNPTSPEAAVLFYRAIAEQLPSAVLALDAQLRVRWANAAALTLIPGAPPDLIGRSWCDLKLPWTLSEQQQRDVFAGSTLELAAKPHPNGNSTRRLVAKIAPLRESGSTVSAALCVIEEAGAGAELSAADTQIGEWHWDYQNGRFSADERWCQVMNVDPCIGDDHLERWTRGIHPDDVAEFRRKRAELESGKTDRIEVEYRMLTLSFRWLWMLQRGRVVERAPDGRPLRVSGICIDIDDRKRAEVALQENEARLATALWGARAAFWQWHIASDTVTMSPLWFAITGYTREQWESVPKPLSSRIHPEDRERTLQQFRHHFEGQTQSIEVEFRIRTASGDWKWVLMRGRVIEWDFEGRPTSAIGVSLDIDQQKRAELELRSSEARLETAVWGAGMGLWELDFRTETTRWFSDWAERLDLDPCSGHDHVSRWDSLIHPDDIGEAARRFNDHVAGKEDYYDAEYRIRDRKGRWRWLFERGRVVERSSDGKALRMVGICMDIDARKEAELASIRSRRHLEVALESARGGMWEWDLVTGVKSQTDFYYGMLGVDPEVGRQDKDFWSSRVHPDDRDRVRAAIQRTIDGETDLYEAEYRLRHADGSWRWVLDRGRAPERDASGKALRLVGFMVDTTERVETQEALRVSEFRYRTVASITPGYVFEYRCDEGGDAHPVWVSDGIEDVYECSREDFIRLGGWQAFCDPEMTDAAQQQRKLVYEGEAQGGEVRVRTYTGKTKWLYASAVPVRDANGKVTGLIGAAYDVTKRKLAEQALRESEAVLRAVTENTPDWLFLIDQNLCVRFMNRTFGKFSKEEVIGRCLLDFLPAEHRQTLEQLYRSVMKSGEPGRIDLPQIAADGSQQYFEHRVIPVVEGSTVRSLTVAVTDVTQRISQENILRTQARILETMREGVVLVDSENRIQLTNATFDKMFGYEAGELLNKSVEPLFSMPATQRKRMERGLHPGAEFLDDKTMPVEFECVHRNGSRFVASCVFTPLTMGGKDHWLAVLNDVTERKRLEREIIEIANREQQRIGSDLHDGLGQDLTGIALMLSGVAAQLEKEGSGARLDIEDVISLVNNAIESTRSLARGLSPVSAERGGLTAALHTLAARAGERYSLRVEFKAKVTEPLRLDETAATHLYRIAQEALTNVIRHSLATEVKILLETSGEELQLRIGDNGRGFTLPAEGVNGLGLKIMRYRAQMLGGDLAVETSVGAGTTIRCSCPLVSSGFTERERAVQRTVADVTP